MPHPVSGESTALFLIHTVEFVHTYYAEEIFVLMIHRFGIDQFLEVMSLSIIYSVKSEPRVFLASQVDIFCTGLKCVRS